MTETIVTETTFKILEYWLWGAVLIVCLMGLIWMTKNLLSSKDKEVASKDKQILEYRKTIDILRSKSDEKDNKLFDFIMKISISMEKWTDLFDKHDQGAQRYREKMIIEVENFKRLLDSIKNK